MSWNRSTGNWSELKGKAKKQGDRTKVDDSDDVLEFTKPHHKKHAEPRKNFYPLDDENLDHLQPLMHKTKKL